MLGVGQLVVRPAPRPVIRRMEVVKAIFVQNGALKVVKSSPSHFVRYEPGDNFDFVVVTAVDVGPEHSMASFAA